MEDPFENMTKNYKEITFNDTVLKVKLHAKECGRLLLMTREIPQENDVDRITDIMSRAIKRMYPKQSDDNIDTLISNNYVNLFKEFMILSGLPRDTYDSAEVNKKTKKK